MVFNSLTFAIFFLVFFSIYCLINRLPKVQTKFILIASLVFYGWWDERFLLLMLFTIVVDFIVGKKLDAADSKDAKKKYLFISIFSNLSILGFFKYFGFFTQSFSDLMSTMGFTVEPLLVNVILPVGISFYTFQSMSYVIDIYKGRLKPTQDLFDYAAYVSLFPQLVAGPIERATHLMPQILNPRKITADNIYSGSYLILWGLFKKIFVADNLAKIVDSVFSGSGEYSGAAVLVGSYAFAFQIYCDFSGYTDIARGVARCMGFNLMKNFYFPYISAGPSEFWRRWHISLSSWLRDYLYIGLGGNRKGNGRTYFNLMATMVIGGLWHGAAWNFVIWGGYQGFLLVVYRFIGEKFSQLKTLKFPWLIKILSIAFFFHLTCYGWLIFRAQSAAQIGDMSAALFQGVDINELFSYAPRLGFYLLPLLVVEALQLASRGKNFVFLLPVPLRALFYVGTVYGILVFGNLSSNEFIYFQF